MSFQQRVTIAPDVLFRVIGDEAVLLNLESELYLGLDSVGTRMWLVLQESPTIQAGYDTLTGEYEVAPDVLRRDRPAALLDGRARAPGLDVAPSQLNQMIVQRNLDRTSHETGATQGRGIGQLRLRTRRIEQRAQHRSNGAAVHRAVGVTANVAIDGAHGQSRAATNAAQHVAKLGVAQDP